MELQPDHKVSTCLWFDTQAGEAVDLYTSLLPNSRILGRSYYGKNAPMPEGTLLTVTFELEGTPYMALNGGPVFRPSEAASIVVACDDQSEIDRLWSGLLEGGGIEQQCGWLKDRFGVSWQIVPRRLHELMSTGETEQRERVWRSMMLMVKFDIAVLDAAWEGRSMP